MIENTESAKKLTSTRKTDIKTGTGVKSNAVHEISFYSSVDDLCNRLALLCAAKEAGNNGLNNNINSILDELLRINAVDKNKYNYLYSNIFNWKFSVIEKIIYYILQYTMVQTYIMSGLKSFPFYPNRLPGECYFLLYYKST